MNVTNKNTFNKNLSMLKASGKTIRVTVQNLVIQAIAFYSGHTNKNGDEVNGDTGYLTTLMEVANDCRSIRASTLQAFIQEHANVKWISKKNKKGQTIKVFQKQGKEVEVKPIESMWYDFDNAGLAKVEYSDFVSRLKNVHKEFKKGDKKPKKGTEVDTQELIKALDVVFLKLAG